MGKTLFAYRMEWFKKELEKERAEKKKTIESIKIPSVCFHEFCKLNNVRLLPIDVIRENLKCCNYLGVINVFDVDDPIYVSYLAELNRIECIVKKKMCLVDKEIESLLHDALFVKGFDFDGALKKFRKAKF
jgi:hypothetical protein